MKAVMKTEPGPGIVVEELPEPEITPDEVLIRIKAVGICGSDVHIFEWTPGYEHLTDYLPLVLGHEFSGEVVEIGSRVSGIRKGDRVVYQGASCGRCHCCITGKQSICDQRRAYGRIGMEKQGGMAQYVAVNTHHAFLNPIPPEISYEEAAMVQPTAEAIHMLERARIFPGDAVAVLGVGPIALTVAQGVKAAGASPLIITGLSQDKKRLSLAETLGVDEAVDVEKEDPVKKIKAMTNGQGAATVFEVSGSPAAFVQGLKMVRKGGTLVTFGIYPEDITIDMTRKVVREMKTISGVYGASGLAWGRVMNLIGSGQIRIAPLITHRLPLSRAEEGFCACVDKTAVKVILLPD
jgi:2-desacetyl-2-hydroxyethyl bacteriochlorophyllide A dehydrogenase